jgi:predicted DNA-binding transcriptional regulator AlpA
MKTETPKLLKQNEVAQIIRKSGAWLERKRWEGGGIPFRKMGRSVLYYESDVLEWIKKYPPLTSTSGNEEGGE